MTILGTVLQTLETLLEQEIKQSS